MFILQIDETMLANLSKEEREAVEQILKEMANNNGNSTLYNKLKYKDFEEIPVEISEFLHNKKYDHYLNFVHQQNALTLKFQIGHVQN